MTTLAIVAAIAYALVVAVMYFAQRALLYPGASKAADAFPATVPWGVRVPIATPDGETLAAVYVAAGKGRPTVLLFPGNGDNVVDYGFVGSLLSARGYGLLAVSYRGYPGSTGSPTEAGLLTDGLAAFDWLSAQDRSSPIVILGRSLGTGVAVNTAAERDAAAIVLISAYKFDPGRGARQISLPSCCSADERQFSIRSPDRSGCGTEALPPRRSRQFRPFELRQGTVRRSSGTQDVQRPARLWPQRHLDAGPGRGRDRVRRHCSRPCPAGLTTC